MKRLDHSMIFLFIAGTYTPFALLAVDQPTGFWVLAGVWAGALAGVVAQAELADRPALGRACRSTSGWAGSPSSCSPTSCTSPGSPSMVLLAVGGLLYTVGGIAYGLKKPNPWPGTFGYHEVFHAMTIVAAICHYIAVYFAMYNSPVRAERPGRPGRAVS